MAELEEFADELGDHVLPAVVGATPNWQLQLGSLGSGNHFIEVTADEQDRVWLFLHSGSRGVGNKIAMRHIAIARSGPSGERLDLPDRDLAWLDEGTPEFDRYIAELRWAQHFALLNREEMMDRVADCLAAAHARRRDAASSSGSSATTTSPSGRRTTASTCGCRARARSRRGRASTGSSPAPWGRRATSSPAWATRCR